MGGGAVFTGGLGAAPPYQAGAGNVSVVRQLGRDTPTEHQPVLELPLGFLVSRLNKPQLL